MPFLTEGQKVLIDPYGLNWRYCVTPVGYQACKALPSLVLLTLVGSCCDSELEAGNETKGRPCIDFTEALCYSFPLEDGVDHSSDCGLTGALLGWQ